MGNNNITLRDYLAGLAMQSLIINHRKNFEVFDNLSKTWIADESYSISDKMIEASKK